MWSLPVAPVQPFITANWYWPTLGSVTQGAAIPTGSIKLVPIFLPRPMTVDQIGAHVATLAAGGNFKMAIYANNPTTARPTGNPIVQSNAAGSTASAVVVTGAVAATGTIPAGLNWSAIQVDASAGGTAVFKTYAATYDIFGAMVGSSTVTDISGAATNSVCGLTVTQAYGSFPDMTSASFATEAANTNAIALVRST